MTKLTKWADIKRARPETPEMRMAYEHSRRGFELGCQLRSLRTVRGLSQAELARLAGTSQAVIARLEAGEGDPALRTLYKLGRALGVELIVRFEEKHDSAFVDAPLAGTRAASTAE